jgi:hypothetical protein
VLTNRAPSCPTARLQGFALNWLFTPLVTAYRTKRSPDYDVERYFQTEKG